MGKLEVRLLGPFEVVVGRKPVDVPGAKRQALVACLALRSGPVAPPVGGRGFESRRSRLGPSDVSRATLRPRDRGWGLVAGLSQDSGSYMISRTS
jgi:hypothetical protein